jgi:hypothetical protein
MSFSNHSITIPTYETPPSPTWANSDYPNIARELDGEDTEIALEELCIAVTSWLKPCCKKFPCEHGRQKQSKRQRKKQAGQIFGQSLCGISKLSHLVTEKRDYIEHTEPSIIAEWWFASDDEEDEEDEYLASRMQITKNSNGHYTHNPQYISYLKNIPQNAIEK